MWLTHHKVGPAPAFLYFDGHVRELFRASLTLIIGISAGGYDDDFAHNVISYIYRQDKYGIVIFYAVSTLIGLFEDVARLLAKGDVAISLKNERSLVVFSAIQRALVVFTGSRVLVFNCVFMFHTSEDNEMHQVIHQLTCYVLAFFCVLCECLRWQLDLTPGYSLVVRFAFTLCLWGRFRFIKTWQETQLCAYSQLWNATVVTTETLLLQQAI